MKQESMSFLKRNRTSHWSSCSHAGCFLFCWTPFFVVHTTRAMCFTCNIPPGLVSTVTWLGYVNSALNPIIYTIFNTEFKKFFKKCFCGCWRSGFPSWRNELGRRRRGSENTLAREMINSKTRKFDFKQFKESVFGVSTATTRTIHHIYAFFFSPCAAFHLANVYVSVGAVAPFRARTEGFVHSMKREVCLEGPKEKMSSSCRSKPRPTRAPCSLTPSLTGFSSHWAPLPHTPCFHSNSTSQLIKVPAKLVINE